MKPELFWIKYSLKERLKFLMVRKLDSRNGLLLLVIDGFSFTQKFIQRSGRNSLFERKVFDKVGQCLSLRHQVLKLGFTMEGNYIIEILFIQFSFSSTFISLKLFSHNFSKFIIFTAEQFYRHVWPLEPCSLIRLFAVQFSDPIMLGCIFRTKFGVRSQFRKINQAMKFLLL